MIVVEKDTEKFLGYLSDIGKIPDVGTRYRYEPFVFKHNFVVFEDEEGNFGVASPRESRIIEVNEQ